LIKFLFFILLLLLLPPHQQPSQHIAPADAQESRKLLLGGFMLELLTEFIMVSIK
jgi:hypothetical protein